MEQALAVVRREHEDLLKKMADGFARVLTEAAWAVPEVLHQARIRREGSDDSPRGRRAANRYDGWDGGIAAGRVRQLFGR